MFVYLRWSFVYIVDLGYVFLFCLAESKVACNLETHQWRWSNLVLCYFQVKLCRFRHMFIINYLPCARRWPGTQCRSYTLQTTGHMDLCVAGAPHSEAAEQFCKTLGGGDQSLRLLLSFPPAIPLYFSLPLSPPPSLPHLSCLSLFWPICVPALGWLAGANMPSLWGAGPRASNMQASALPPLLCSMF